MLPFDLGYAMGLIVGVGSFTGDRRQDGRYTIPAGESLVLRYGVLVHRGNASQADVAGAYRQFAAQQ